MAMAVCVLNLFRAPSIRTHTHSIYLHTNGLNRCVWASVYWENLMPADNRRCSRRHLKPTPVYLHSMFDFHFHRMLKALPV